MKAIRYDLPTIAWAAGGKTSGQSFDLEKLPEQAAPGVPYYVRRLIVRAHGTLTIATVAGIVNIANLLKMVDIQFPNAGPTLLHLPGKWWNVLHRLENAGRRFKSWTFTPTTVALTYRDTSTDNPFAGVATDNAGGSIAFDVEFEYDLSPEFASDPVDYEMLASIFKCLDFKIDFGTVAELSESGTVVTACTCTLEPTVELLPRYGTTLGLILSRTYQLFDSRQPKGLDRLNGGYRALGVVGDHATINNAMPQTDAVNVSARIAGYELQRRQVHVRNLYREFNRKSDFHLLQDHTTISQANAMRDSALPFIGPGINVKQKLTELKNANVAPDLEFDVLAEDKALLQSVSQYWTTETRELMRKLAGLPAGAVFRPATSSHMAAPTDAMAETMYPLKWTGEVKT